MKTHDKSFSYTPIAIALALSTAAQTIYAAPPSCSTSGGTTTCNGTSGTYNDSIVETGGNPTTVHNLIVNNVDIANFTSGANFTGLPYKSGISLAGNNANPVPHSALGSLTVTVNGGSITGTSTGYLSGIYTRSDSDNADVTVNTNTQINISSSGAPLYGILTEHFAGANGSANVVLNNGSNITITSNGAVSGAGVRVASTGADGLASLTANGAVSVSTIGDNLHGYSVGATGANGDANIDLSNTTTSSTVSTNGLNSVGILATSSSGNATINAKGSVSSLNTGTASSGSTFAHGIFAQTSGGAGTTAKVTYGDGTVTVKGSGIDTGENTIAGILAKALGDGDAAITFNSGSVVMDGGTHTVALGAYTNGTGDVLVDFLGGSIQTSQNGAGTATDTDGIHAHARGTGDVIINSYGDITTSGTDISEGIIAVATGGNVTVDAKGNISTIGLGDRNKGILVQTIVAGNTAKVTYNDAAGSISTLGTNSHAIEVNSGAGDAIIDVKAAQLIKTTGDGAHGLYAHATGAGTVNITNGGVITTTGDAARGIEATSVSGKIDITNTANITTDGESSHGIYANSGLNAAPIDIINNSDITVSGTRTHGILAISDNGSINIANTANIKTYGETSSIGIIGMATSSGDVSIKSIGANISTAGKDTVANHGIEARTVNGTSSIFFQDGTVTVHGKSSGLAAWNGFSTLSGSADVTVINSLIDASQAYGHYAIQSSATDNAKIYIDATSVIHGGAHNGFDSANVFSSGFNGGGIITSAANVELVNHGTVDALSDRAIRVDLSNNALIDNYGSITGFFTIQNGSNVTVNNWSNLDLRNYADTDGDGLRDTKAVAISTFGGSDSNFTNQINGVIRLLPVSGETTVNTAKQWLHDGQANHSIDNPGITQAQLLKLGRFENKGMIDLTGSGLPGDTLVISGHSAAGASKADATGVFVTGGSLKIDTVLNKGDEDSKTDLLSVDNVKLGDAPTVIYVNKVGGKGALTNGNGIEIIDVRNHSDADAFVLGNRVVAGPYEYMLYNGSRDYAANSWFLRTNDSNGVPIYRVEVGSYLANQTAATGLFMHTLHDRLGEPQFTEGSKSEGKVGSGWVRIVGTHTDSTAAGGVIDQDTDSYLVHFGGELAQWSNGGSDRLHLGLMGAYGESKTDSSVTYHTPKSITRTSEGKVTGFSTGVYATWYQNAAQPQGLYLDSWLQYGWFDNKVTGQGEPTQSYDSNVLTASIEAGYALVVRDGSQRQWIIEPQAQLAYNSYSADDVVDNYGMKVSGSDADGVVTRLGARMYSRSKLGDNGIQPFVEANWWYGSADNSLEFDGIKVKNDMPENRFELKAGLQGEITKNWQLWGHIGGQWGENSYKRYEGMVGLKHLF